MINGSAGMSYSIAGMIKAVFGKVMKLKKRLKPLKQATYVSEWHQEETPGPDKGVPSTSYNSDVRFLIVSKYRSRPVAVEAETWPYYWGPNGMLSVRKH